MGWWGGGGGLWWVRTVAQLRPNIGRLSAYHYPLCGIRLNVRADIHLSSSIIGDLNLPPLDIHICFLIIGDLNLPPRQNIYMFIGPF